MCPLCLVLAVALGQADIDILRQIGWDHLAEFLDVLAVDLLGEPESGVDNTSVKSKEALSYLVCAGVLGVQGGDEDSLFAVVVELEVDGTLGEDSAFEFVQGTCDFGVLAGGDEGILEHVAEAEVGAFDKSQELSCSRVNVRRVCRMISTSKQDEMRTD